MTVIYIIKYNYINIKHSNTKVSNHKVDLLYYQNNEFLKSVLIECGVVYNLQNN